MATLVWDNWSATTNSTTSIAWYDWLVSESNSTANAVTWSNWATTLNLTATQRAATVADFAAREAQRATRMAEAAAAHAAHEAAQRQAKERAEKLLTRLLPERKRRQRKREGFFDFRGSKGRLYRIHAGTHGNIREMERQADGTLRAIARLCCQPAAVPEADAHLAQYLWLKHDEEAFRRVANIERYLAPPAQAA